MGNSLLFMEEFGMTTKRFKFICDDEKCFFKDGNKALYCYEVVDLLNSLSNENEQLKERNQRQAKRLAEANEERGLAIMTYLHDNYYDIWEEVNKELFKE